LSGLDLLLVRPIANVFGTKIGRINRATERRQKLIDYLTDVFTSPDCPISAEDRYHFSFVAHLYASREAVNRLSASYDEWPQVREEVLFPAAVEALNRLIQ